MTWHAFCIIILLSKHQWRLDAVCRRSPKQAGGLNATTGNERPVAVREEQIRGKGEKGEEVYGNEWKLLGGSK